MPSAVALRPWPHLSVRRPFVWTIALCVFFSAWWLYQSLAPSAVSYCDLPKGGKDLQAYRQIVARVHHGENYYTAAGEVLRDGGYFASSVFNWRLPTYAWLFAAFPDPIWAQGLLICLAQVALALAFRTECKTSNVGRAMILIMLMLGCFLWCIDGDAFFSQELWAGVLIALSVSAFAGNLRPLGVSAGLAALFMRELALPYVAISIALALRERRYREVAIWCVGLLLFAAYFTWHAWQVQLHLTGSELVDTDGWIQFGGPAFVIETVKMNLWLFKLPSFIALLYLIVAILGLSSWRGPMSQRIALTAAVYLLAFLIIGKPFNAYWGLLYVTLLPFSLVRLPHALQSLRNERRGLSPP